MNSHESMGKDLTELTLATALSRISETPGDGGARQSGSWHGRH